MLLESTFSLAILSVVSLKLVTFVSVME